MAERRRELARRVARQLGVAVEHEHVAGAGESLDRAGDRREPARIAAQEIVEILELAALALPAHPRALARVPRARAVKQMKAAAGVLRVERLDRAHRALDQRVVAIDVLGGRVAKVGDQRERDVRIAVREEPDLKQLDEAIDLRGARQHRGHRDERAVRVGHAAREVEPRQRGRPDDHRRGPMHDADRELARGERDRDRPRGGQRRVMADARRDRGGQRRRRADDDREVHGEPRAPAAVAVERAMMRSLVERELERAAAAIDQEETDVPAARRGLARGELDRALGDRDLGPPRAARELLDDVAVAIARREVHRRVDAGRIAAQRDLDRAEIFDEVAPVDRVERPQARDAVADRDLIRRLALRRRLERVLDGLAAILELLLEPAHRQLGRGALAGEPARELGDERDGHRRIGRDQLRERDDRLRRIAPPVLEQRVGPFGGALAIAAAGRHARDHAAQVLEQREPQHDRDRPQLAELERLHALIRGDERVEHLLVDAAVRVRDQLEREIVDARHARVAVEPRQHPAVAARQVAPGDQDLIVEQVVVVDEPLGGRRDLPAARDRVGDQPIRVGQRLLVVGEPLEQPIFTAPRADRVRAGEHLRVMLELAGAEQLGAQRRERRRHQRSRLLAISCACARRSAQPHTR